jgi:hypothetical protein
LSDRVIREEGTGKLSLIGWFDAFITENFPFQSVPFFVTVAVTNIAKFPDELNVVLRIETPGTGHVIASSNANLRRNPESPPIPRSGVIEITFPFQSIRFDSPGAYDVVCLVSNEPIGKRQVEVKPITARPNQV